MNEKEELKRIRTTDNSAKGCDGVQPTQEAKPLELDENGIPIDFPYGGGED